MRKERVKPWLSPRKDNVDSKRGSVEYEKHSAPLIATLIVADAYHSMKKFYYISESSVAASAGDCKSLT